MILPRLRKNFESQDTSDPVSFYHDGSIFVLLEVPGAFNGQEVQQGCEAIARAIETAQFTTAEEFEEAVSKAFHSANLTLSFSVSLLLFREGEVYLKTYGSGDITLQRGSKMIPLVTNGAYGKGAVKDSDVFKASLVGEHSSSHVEIEMHDRMDEVSLPAPVIEAAPVTEPSAPEIARRSPPTIVLTRRLISYIFLGLVACLLIWNLIGSYNSKSAQDDRRLIAQVDEIVTQKLDQAQDIFELNAGRSSALVAEAKNDIDQLEKKLHAPHEAEVTKLREAVSAMQRQLLGNNVKKAEEYLDLTLEKKDARAEKMWRYDDQVVLLDSRGTVYVASLKKKTLDSVSSSSIARSNIVGLNENSVYFYKQGSGVGHIDLDGGNKKVVIKNDSEWGSITDMKIYNQNIYLLDGGKGQIWKYVPTEDGYASKSAYFKSTAYALKAQSFAFDQSVYVGQSNLLTKYTAGLQDGFSPRYPGDAPMVTRVIASPDLDSVYIWSKSTGTLTSLSADGTYERTYESSILKTASSVEVYEDAGYALVGSKIYRISLK